ncbi:MAG TPA: twin-arginine translocation signal domain-containing protein, partial [Bryobacteraceae bacterium]|nr:twin-arginine translocation signal domain-containing protein [Bryobacteraceae bacterium]
MDPANGRETATSHSDEVDRRQFLKRAGSTVLAGSATALSARSYARVLGANDRIRIGQLGC